MSHPMTVLLQQYITDFHKFKLQNEDLSNMMFNKMYGLYVNPPTEWPIAQIVSDTLSYVSKSGSKSFVIVYSSTDVYNKISDAIDQSHQVTYFSWHEMYSAMMRAGQDISYIEHLKKQLRESDLVFFVGVSSAINEVIDQIKGSTVGCLIMIG